METFNNYLEYTTNTTDLKRYHLDLEQLYKSDFNKNCKILSIDKDSKALFDIDILYYNVFQKCNEIQLKKELTLFIPSVIDKQFLTYFKTSGAWHREEQHLNINPQFIAMDGKFHIRNRRI